MDNLIAILFVAALVIASVMGCVRAVHRQNDENHDMDIERAIQQERLLLLREQRLRAHEWRLYEREQRIRDKERSLGLSHD